MKLILPAGLLVIGSILFFTFKASAAAPKAGDAAPLFTAVDQDGKEFKLADLIGKKVVLLYFRYTVKTVAAGCEITGLVRNLPDGRVELITEGTREELEAFRAAIRDEGLAGFIQDEH